MSNSLGPCDMDWSDDADSPVGKCTPGASSTTSQPCKRKATEAATSGKGRTSRLLETSQSFSADDPNFLSSTRNESITGDFMKFNLDSFASGYYVERSNSTTAAGETPTSVLSYERQAHRVEDVKPKEPSTPTKIKPTFYSGNGTSPMQKLGSPERNEILYPSLLRTGSFRQSLGDHGKRFSPAKKRLFVRRLKDDPVYFFWNKNKKYPEIVTKIFLYLSDEDLYFCSKVSRNWKNAVTSDLKIKDRIKRYSLNKVMNKENCCDVASYKASSPVDEVVCASPFKDTESPVLDTSASKKFYEVTNTLKEGQRLEKCARCCEPAIVECSISQCTRDMCGYIRCVKCDSFSATGPEDFIDSCQQSGLVVKKPKSKFSQMTSPPRGGYSDSGVPTFFLDDSFTPSANSSGYVTGSDVSNHHGRYSASFAKGKSRILQSFNADHTPTRANLERRSSIVPVVALNVKKVKQAAEPPSPPKVKEVACSKKSRINLRRLKF